MPKTKISEYSATANSNTDVASINIDEGCAPSGINNAIRAVMGHLKDFQSGTSNDPFTVGSSGSLTLSYGTANGVAYLNGSKVLTTGSALTFNGSALAVTGTISSNNGSANNLLSINGDGAIQSGVQFKANGAGPYTTIYFDNATNHTYYKNLASGGHLFFNNSTQAMTLDASGNFGVGITSPTQRFQVEQTQNGSTWAYITNGNSGTGAAAGVLFGTDQGAAGALSQNSSNAGYGTAANALRLRNLLNAPLTFETNGSERARIDSSGNLLVGTTSQSASERFNATNSAANSQAIIANATSSSFNGDVVLVRAARNTTNSTFSAFSYYNDGAAAYKLRIWDSGNVVNTNNSYGAISDAKLKENIVDATPKLEKLNQVRVVNFNFIGDQQKQLGVVAQELEQIFPGMIDESPDKDAEGNDLGTTTKSVKYSVFVPMLIKAIQEQQAIIQSLTARITALESA